MGACLLAFSAFSFSTYWALYSYADWPGLLKNSLTDSAGIPSEEAGEGNDDDQLWRPPKRGG